MKFYAKIIYLKKQKKKSGLRNFTNIESMGKSINITRIRNIH